MPNSQSPSISGTTLTCQSASGRGGSNNSMRLPSMEELLRKTGRLSERNRTLGHFNSPSTSVNMSSQGFVDLTSDSFTSSFNLPSFQHFSNTSLSSTPVSDSPYSSFFDMPPRVPRRSRGPSTAVERPAKRRRGNDFDGFPNSRPSSSHSTTYQSSYKTEPVDVLDLITPRKEEKKDADTNKASRRRRVEEDLLPELQEDTQQMEPPNEQDKQLADAIKAQAGQPQSTPRLSQLTCIICMDNMVDMTATICGHLFCHKCITDALIAGENNGWGGGARGPAPRCPMCRTKLRRKVPRGHPDIVPLTLKLMKRSDKSKGKQRGIL